ncbi:MAG TPA: two-component regulator propeller domain-containing protein, partial [Chitinophagaceae bacterium]|nr:two-component regulator propeller domain-containing protein [Chitinophagaceae bacterium]
MKTAGQYIFYCFTICVCLPTFAQQFSILNYTVNDGLPSNQINSTCEDSYGFLWIGTSNGLSRFNGKNFVNYGYTEGLQDLFVTAIYEDSYHRLWVGTLRGISELRGNRFITHHAKNNAEFIVCGFEEMNGHELWATTSKGIYCYQLLPGKEKKISFIYNMSNAIGYPFADRNHNLWLASYDGLIRIQPKIFGEIYSSQKASYQKKPYITSAGNNQLLIFGADGPQYYKNGHISNLQLPSSYSDLNNYLQDVVEGSDKDSKNNIWFITRFRKLFRWSGSRLQ